MPPRSGSSSRSVDPNATVVCPGMGRLWQPDGLAALKDFARLGGYDHCDVASVKLYQQHASDPPETMLKLTSKIDHLLHGAGVLHRSQPATGSLQFGGDECAIRRRASSGSRTAATTTSTPGASTPWSASFLCGGGVNGEASNLARPRIWLSPSDRMIVTE
jgi:hypothetical protein